jgi:hypothetical protein
MLKCRSAFCQQHAPAHLAYSLEGISRASMPSSYLELGAQSPAKSRSVELPTTIESRIRELHRLHTMVQRQPGLSLANDRAPSCAMVGYDRLRGQPLARARHPNLRRGIHTTPGAFFV